MRALRENEDQLLRHTQLFYIEVFTMTSSIMLIIFLFCLFFPSIRYTYLFSSNTYHTSDITGIQGRLIWLG